jgi:thioredoxin
VKYKNATIIIALVIIFGCLVLSAAYIRYVYNEPYNPIANSRAEISQALAKLKKDKLLIIILGANWCPQCRNLASDIITTPLKNKIDASFSVVKVDVNGWDRNMDIVEMLDNPIKGGIPTIVVVNKDKQIILTTTGIDLAKARKSTGSYLRYFSYIEEKYLKSEKLFTTGKNKILDI